MSMKKHLLNFACITALIISLSISLSSCGKDILGGDTPLKSGETQVTVSGTGQGTGHFYATNTQVTEGSSTYFIVASVRSATNEDSLVIHILIPKQATAPYTVDVKSDATAVVDYCVTTSTGTCVTYRSKQGVGTATVKVTDISSNVQGTFSGTLQADNGATSITFSSGGFNASF